MYLKNCFTQNTITAQIGIIIQLHFQLHFTSEQKHYTNFHDDNWNAFINQRFVSYANPLVRINVIFLIPPPSSPSESTIRYSDIYKFYISTKRMDLKVLLLELLFIYSCHTSQPHNFLQPSNQRWFHLCWLSRLLFKFGYWTDHKEVMFVHRALPNKL